MALQFIKKRFRKRPEYKIVPMTPKIEKEEVKMAMPQGEEVDTKVAETKITKKKSKKDMINKDQISAIEAAIENMQPEIKVVKKDRGLIERTESSKIIITEDNRQVLND